VTNYTILLLQEQFWSTFMQESPSHHAWLKYEPTNKDKPPRVTTYVNKSQVSAAQIEQVQLPFTDVVALKITPRNEQEPPTLIINIYNPCDESLITKLREGMRQIKYKDGTMTIIAGDFNCHHPRWNPTSYTRHDDTANDLVELATEFGLDLLLPPGTVTYPHAETTIDLVWGCSKVQERILKCQIASQCDQGSDHWPVETILSAKDNRISETPSYNVSKANWPRFHEVLVTYLTAQTAVPTTTAEIEERSAELVNILQTAMAESMPLRQPSPRCKRWWTPELTALGRAQKSLKNRWRRAKTACNRRLWREKANEYTSEISRTKTTHWQEYVKSLDGKTIWDVKRYLTQSSVQTTIPTLDNVAETYEEMTDTLKCRFFPPLSPAIM
jgi:Endonuclease-reverse transcriptase